jgi:PAS domain S-box-containing protein
MMPRDAVHPLEWRRYLWLAAAIWTVTIGVLIAYDIVFEQNRMLDLVGVMARTMAWQDQHWVTMKTGNIFAPVGDPLVAGDEHSEMPSETVETKSGIRLAKVNPTALMRSLNQLPHNRPGEFSRLTSLHPVDSAPAPDEWESAALRRIQGRGGDFADIDGEGDMTRLRLMVPLRSDSSCLSCHGWQDNAQGDLRGGISVSLSLEPYKGIVKEHRQIELLGHGVLWLTGLAGLFVLQRQIKEKAAQRVTAQQALRDSEERYARIVTTPLVGIWELDAEGRTTFANARMAEMLGCTVAEMIGSSMYEFVDPAVRLQAQQNLQRRGEGIEEQHEFKFRRRDGTSVDTLISTRVIRDSAGWVQGALGIIVEIGTLKKMQQDLRESEERLRMLVESTDDVIAMQDLEGRFLYINPARRYGVGAHELAGKMPEEIFDASTAERNRALLREVIETGNPSQHEELVSWRGESLWFDSRRYPVHEDQGNIRAVTMFSRNITGQKEAEARLSRAEEQLRLEALRLQISEDLHDDLGSTLSSTSIFAAMLEREIGKGNQRVTEILDRVQRNLGAAQESLHDIVWAINPQNESMESFIIRLREYAFGLCEPQQIRLETLSAETLGQVKLAMPVRRDLYLIMKEALNNIVKHAHCTKVRLEMMENNQSLQITIADNGRGFDSSLPSRGNGLASMRHRASRMGGILNIESSPSSGTMVNLCIPIA